MIKMLLSLLPITFFCLKVEFSTFILIVNQTATINVIETIMLENKQLLIYSKSFMHI